MEDTILIFMPLKTLDYLQNSAQMLRITIHILIRICVYLFISHLLHTPVSTLEALS